MTDEIPLGLNYVEAQRAGVALARVARVLGANPFVPFGKPPQHMLSGDVARVLSNVGRWADGVDTFGLGDDLTGKRREGYELAMLHIKAIAARTVTDPDFGLTLQGRAPTDLGR